MELIPLFYVPLAVMMGFGLHYVLFRPRAPKGPTTRLTRRPAAILMPLISLPVWVTLCYAFKLLTWKPFAADFPGSVRATNFLLLCGSALIGMWMSVRVRQR